MKVYNTYRLVADEGKLVTNGIIKGKVLDLGPDEKLENWYEIDEPKTESETESEVIQEDHTENEIIEE